MLGDVELETARPRIVRVGGRRSDAMIADARVARRLDARRPGLIAPFVFQPQMIVGEFLRRDEAAPILARDVDYWSAVHLINGENFLRIEVQAVISFAWVGSTEKRFPATEVFAVEQRHPFSYVCRYATARKREAIEEQEHWSLHDSFQSLQVAEQIAHFIARQGVQQSFGHERELRPIQALDLIRVQ